MNPNCIMQNKSAKVLRYQIETSIWCAIDTVLVNVDKYAGFKIEARDYGKI